ncbi:MAG: molybdopterin-synthase adenylyltransferase MoeB [Gemmatimonadota bacterium]|nr:molybdopterin-synthase adenylyltransferase MoeB [Gemmatimonadota bacterium]
MNFAPDELLRYSRHLTLPEVGVTGQERLRDAKVLLIGAGGLGSPAALYLAAAGVGRLGLVEFDTVDLSNLQRQILHGTSAVGTPKLESAKARLADLNPHVEVVTYPHQLTSANAVDTIRGWDIVLDGSDNFPTRYLVNDACVLLSKPYVYGSIFRFDGQVSVFGAPDGPCYRCLFAEPPPVGLVPNCAEAGVLGVLPGIIGSLQALEAIKMVIGIGESLIGRLVLFDALSLRFRELAVRRDPACAVCGDAPTVTELVDYEAFCGVGAPKAETGDIAPQELSAALGSANPPLVLDVREEWEHGISRIAGSILIPLHQLPERVNELDSRRDIVALCHHGLRSRTAQQFLLGAGFHSVRNLAGGIDRWSEQVEGGKGRY